ncbi:cytochrome P450 [Nocardioides ginsengisoli]|uniref:Cytochrome P450 n=1 Tax=Nocardioides ginsengisoli TaxID=363868 RepID=A0ABW3VVX3_9ACTN
MTTFLEDVPASVMDEDPYPIFERLRKEAPVAYYPGTDQWFIARWDDNMRVGTDAENFGPSQWTVAGVGPSVLSASGEQHRWIRKGIDPLLRQRPIHEYAHQHARPLVASYLDQLAPRGEAELTSEFFELISARIVGDVLGLHGIDDETRQRWFLAIADWLNQGSIGNVEVSSELTATLDELDSALEELVAEVTKKPDGTLLSTMVHAVPDGAAPKTYEELAGSIRIIIAGGFQEPGHAAASILYGLLSNPDQYADLVASDGKLVQAAVHEGLRWLPPFSSTERVTLREVEIGGVVLPKNTELCLLIASANYDESRWENPSRYDLHRPMQAHCSFGFGVHMCAGNALGRQMEHILLEELPRRLPNLRLNPDREAKTSGFLMRGVKSLSVLWDA